jgi:chromosome partitioning protein
VAADVVLVPMQAEYYALEGLSDLAGTIERVRGTLNPGLRIDGVLLTMFDARNNLSNQVAEEVRKHFHVFETVIPRNVRLAEAPSYGRPVLLYDAGSRGSHGYLSLAREILEQPPAVA